jgi:hypothetical protein
MLDVLHADDLSPEEKAVGLRVLAGLAHSLSGHWRLNSRYYGESAERVWWRMSGLDRDGEVSEQMNARARGWEEPDYEGRHRADSPEGSGGGEDA